MADALSGHTQGADTGDLRKQSVDKLIDEVQARLGTGFDESTIVRKRRSVGVRTDRGTWVRIEARPLDKAASQEQVNNGIEASALLEGIAKPQWYRAVSWLDESLGVLWRADECALVTGPAAKPIGYPLTEPELSPQWWRTLNSSLDSLARQRTTRVATPDTKLIIQALVTETIEQAFPDQVDTMINNQPWVPAHADLNWSNLTAPDCWILDWEDFGLAPRGLDAATLWTNSLMVPTLADKVFRERRADLATRSGKLMALFCCSKDLNDPDFASAPAFKPTAQHAAELVEDLRH
ncbi:phosphotransferase [Nocardia nepalensis]|uniref:phosphotransferase n=1 Tax=Nocardia nepalensis TaxID=3375448 RepID=UPI003B67BD3E